MLTGHESFTSFWKNVEPLFFAKMFLFSHVGVFWRLTCWCILNHCLALKLQGMNWSPDILLRDFLVESRIHGFIIHSKSSGSWSSKATHNHDTITRSDCWYEVLLPKYCVSFTNRQVLFPSFFDSWSTCIYFLKYIYEGYKLFKSTALCRDA